MNPTRIDGARGVQQWQSLASESVFVRGTRWFAGWLTLTPQPRATQPPVSTDEALVRIGDSSVLVRALSWPGQLCVRAWPESCAAAATSRWLSIPLDVRVRFVAIAVSSAIVTHVALTGFRAPQPTPAARIAWISVLLVLIAIAAGARTIAVAWRDWRVRRMQARESGTA
jgi:hypothetical protein